MPRELSSVAFIWIVTRVTYFFREARPFVDPSDEDILERLLDEGLSMEQAYRGLRLIRTTGRLKPYDPDVEEDDDLEEDDDVEEG
jgi:hypothetical protein